MHPAVQPKSDDIEDRSEEDHIGVDWRNGRDRWRKRFNWTMSRDYRSTTTHRNLQTKILSDSTTRSTTTLYTGLLGGYGVVSKQPEGSRNTEDIKTTPQTSTTTTSVALTATLASLAVIVVLLIILIVYFGYVRRCRRLKRSANSTKSSTKEEGIANYAYDRTGVHVKVDRLSIIPECAEEQEYDYVDPDTTTLTIISAAHLQLGGSHSIYEPMITSGLDHHVYAESAVPTLQTESSPPEYDSTSAPPIYTELKTDSMASTPPIYTKLESGECTLGPPEYAELESSDLVATDQHNIDNSIYQDIEG